MARPVTLVSGQWADLEFRVLCQKAQGFGYDGLELATWGNHFEVTRALTEDGYCENHWDILRKHNLDCFAISNHLVGQSVCDNIDSRHKSIVPPHVWGDGAPEGVRQRAAEEMKKTARAAARFGVKVVTGFTGSSIWHLTYSFPPVDPKVVDAGFQDLADRWNPILDVFDEVGVRFALEVHPTGVAFDIVSAQRALESLNHREAFGFNYDPSHFGYQGVDYVAFIRIFRDRIYHAHIKDAYWSPTLCRGGVFGGHLPFGHPDRYWDFRSPGRGSVNFEEVLRALNEIGYQGPLSVEWEDPSMDREHGATEAAAFVRSLDFPPSQVAFDAAFARD